MIPWPAQREVANSHLMRYNVHHPSQGKRRVNQLVIASYHNTSLTASHQKIKAPITPNLHTTNNAGVGNTYYKRKIVPLNNKDIGFKTTSLGKPSIPAINHNKRWRQKHAHECPKNNT